MVLIMVLKTGLKPEKNHFRFYYKMVLNYGFNYGLKLCFEIMVSNYGFNYGFKNWFET